MDTTETYIKMRLAAISDLGMGVPPSEYYSHTGDKWYSWQTATIFIDGKGDWYYSTKDDATQLERQDQLQEMVGQELPLEGQEWNFHAWVTNGRMASIYTSMEQLWLAFCMSELYGKIWKGESWKTDI